MVTISDKARAMNELCNERAKFLQRAADLNQRARAVHEKYVSDLREISSAQMEILDKMAELDSFLCDLSRLDAGKRQSPPSPLLLHARWRGCVSCV